MGTSLTRHKLTAYQSIPTFMRSMKVEGINDLYHIGNLIEAMRTWNLHGSANNLMRWAANTHDHIDEESVAAPLGVMDWDYIDWEFSHLIEENDGRL